MNTIEAASFHQRVVTLDQLHSRRFNPWWRRLKSHVLSGSSAHNDVAIVGPSGVGKTALQTAMLERAKAEFPGFYITVFGLGIGLSFGRDKELRFITRPQGEIPKYEYERNSLHITHVGSLSRAYFPDRQEVGFYDGSMTAMRNKFGQLIGVDRDYRHLERIGRDGGYFVVMLGLQKGVEDTSNLAYHIREKLPEIPSSERLVFLQKDGVYPDQTDGEALLLSYGIRTGNRATRVQQINTMNDVMFTLIETGELPQPTGFIAKKPDDFLKHPRGTLRFQMEHFAPLWLERTLGSDYKDRSLVIVNRRVSANTGIREFRSLLIEYAYPRQLLRMAVEEAEERGERDTHLYYFMERLLRTCGVPFNDYVLVEGRSWSGYDEWLREMKGEIGRQYPRLVGYQS